MGDDFLFVEFDIVRYKEPETNFRLISTVFPELAKNNRIFFLCVSAALLLVSASAAFSTTVFAATSQSTVVVANSSYSGYEVTGPYTTLRVEGSWIVPMVNCTATPNSVSNISVVIDGIKGEGDAMMVGTYQDCVKGNPSYGAFVYIYPMTTYFGENNGNISNVVVHPGDLIEAQGTWRPSAQKPMNWNTNFEDKTTGGLVVDTDARSPAGFTPKLDSGALILSSDGHTLTTLSEISTGRQYTDIHDSDITGAQSGIVTFGETGALSGYTTYQLGNATSLTDSGSSFQIPAN